MRNEEQVVIELPDGNTWTVKRRLTRGDRRYIDKRVRDESLQQMADVQHSGVDLTQLQSIARQTEAQEETESPAAAAVEWGATEEDETLLRASLDWSYPEEITLEAIMERDEDAVQLVVDRLKELYRRRTQEERENLDGSSLNHSNSLTSLSQQSL